MSRKLTIKELAARLGVSVPTLRKYGECGLLNADAVFGRTNLFDENAALQRIDEINRLKSRGYSLSVIREHLDQRPNGFTPLDCGLEGPQFSHGRHVLLIVKDLDEYHGFARAFIGNGLRAGQGVVLVVQPDYREPLEAMVREAGYDIADLERRRQLVFTAFENLAHFDGNQQLQSFDALVKDMISAGCESIRILGHPIVDSGEFESGLDDKVIQQYEQRVSAWAKSLPIILVCPWMATRYSSETLLTVQRNHKEFVVGDSIYVKA